MKPAKSLLMHPMVSLSALLLLIRMPAMASTITVLNTNDNGTGSFRSAVSNAIPGDTIDFAPGVAGGINFTSAPVTLDKSLIILGPGAATLTLTAAGQILTVSVGTILLADLALKNGFNTNGGAIRLTSGALTISNCVFSGNTAPPGQGGKGGGINVSGGSLAVINSMFSGGKANLGGGIYNNGGQVALTNSTFSANEATIAGGSGAAIYNETGSTVTIQSCTVVSNKITSGFGFAGGILNNGTAQLCSTIVAGNTAPTGPDLAGSFVSYGYNLIGTNFGATGFTNGINHDLVGTNALVGALQDNGGPTPTMALLGGSPALDKGISAGLTTDQRGQPRPFDNLMVPNAAGGDGADIGAYESSLVVQNTNDSGAGSLRQALLDNVGLGGGNTIAFASNVTGAITLLTGELLVTRNVSLVGPGDQLLTVSGNNTNRIFHLTNGAVATISGLTLAQGRGANGGAILQDSGTLNLSLSTISSNVSTAPGGGIAASGNLGLVQCTLADNRGTLDGGAIFQSTGSLSVAGCTLTRNFSSIRGGAITVNPDATAVINSSTFCSNNATFGGALMLYPIVKITNCTFTANSAVFGGAIDNFATAATTVRNSILAQNTASFSGWDCEGTFISGGFNLIGAAEGSSGWTGPADQVGSTNSPINPLLGALRSNGGPTFTKALLAGSPAIDNGSSSASTDQRGAPRPFDFASISNASGGNGSDIGAFELGAPVLRIQRSGATNVVVSWPAVYGDFFLESNGNLPGSNTWVAFPATPVVVGDQFNVTTNTATAGSYFRLRAF